MTNMNIDWNKVQDEYNAGLSMYSLTLKYKTGFTTIKKKIKTRTISESAKLIRKLNPDNFKLSDITKEKLRKKRFEYLKKKTGKTAWEKRANGEMSHLEKWFYDEVIIKNKLEEKYDIISELPEYPYFIDFAFINIKVAVELDGKCHFRNGNKRLERDIKKDNKLIINGWKVYRIKYDECNNESIYSFLHFLSNIQNIEDKVYGNRLYKYSDIKTKDNTISRKEYFEKLRYKNSEKELKYIQPILDSNIDFSKFGWVKKVSQIINKKPQKVNKWMKTHMLEFYIKSCFKKGIDSL